MSPKLNFFCCLQNGPAETFDLKCNVFEIYLSLFVKEEEIYFARRFPRDYKVTNNTSACLSPGSEMSDLKFTKWELHISVHMQDLNLRFKSHSVWVEDMRKLC